MNNKFLNRTLLGLGLFILAGCADLNDPYYGRNDPYYPPPPPAYGRDGYYGDRDYDYRNRREWERARDERRDAERERDRLEDERRRLEEERNRNNRPPPPPQVQETCPPGFSRSEQKCSPEERRRGCKDIRLPNGTGCVRR